MEYNFSVGLPVALSSLVQITDYLIGLRVDEMSLSLLTYFRHRIGRHVPRPKEG